MSTEGMLVDTIQVWLSLLLLVDDFEEDIFTCGIVAITFPG